MLGRPSAQLAQGKEMPYIDEQYCSCSQSESQKLVTVITTGLARSSRDAGRGITSSATHRLLYVTSRASLQTSSRHSFPGRDQDDATPLYHSELQEAAAPGEQ